MTFVESILERPRPASGCPSPRWLARAVLAPRVAMLADAVPSPRLVSAELKHSRLLRDYVVHWATQADRSSRFAMRTRLVGWLPGALLPWVLTALGYDGLIYFRDEAVIGHFFYQRRGDALRGFSVAVNDSLAGKGYSAVIIMDFLAHASSLPGIARARVGTGRLGVTRRLLQRLKPHEDQLGLHVSADGWVTFPERRGVKRCSR